MNTNLEWLENELEAADRDNNRELYLAFLDQIDRTADYQTVKDSYLGTYTDVTDFAWERVEGEIPDYLAYYFDYEAFADDLKNGYHFVDLPNGDTAIFEL